KQPNVTYLDFLEKAEEKNLDIIAFADHNSVSGYARYLEEVESLELLERLKRLRDDERKRLDEYRRLREKILVLPGFEFTATLGFHILGIFPPETTVRELEHLLLSLRVPTDKLDQGSGEVGATTDALTAYRMINEAGGIVIAAHANSSHGVAMPGFDFGGQTRIAYTQDSNLHALEVTDLDSKSRRRTAAFFSGTKPEYPRRMHCIQGSDAHKLLFDPKYKNEMGVGDRATEILLDEVSFDAIKELFLGSDFSRTRPYRPMAVEPFDPIREAREQGDTLIQSFHEHLTEKRGVARGILEDVVALANTNGGTVYIGASASAKTPVVGVDRPDHAIAELRAAIAKDVTPPLEVQIEVLKSQGRNVLQLIVPRGSDVPYALESSHIYVRSENETGLAMRDEIVQLVREALAVELAAAAPVAPGETRPTVVSTAPAPETKAAAPAPIVVPPMAPPRTGVEIVSSEVRKSVRYYSVRDLRNMRVVHNVTLASARRLWQYAIEEVEKNPCDPRKVQWVGDIGIWKTYKRGGKSRQDLVQRVGDKLFVYYGVTEDGIHGHWHRLVEGESAEAEEQPEPEARTEAAAPTEMGAANAEPAVAAPAAAEEPPEETFQPPVIPDQVAELFPGESVVAAEEPQAELEAPAESATRAVEALPPQVDETWSATEPRAEEPAPPAPQLPESAHDLATREPASLVPKSRAQAWREQLDKAMADARAVHQADNPVPAPQAGAEGSTSPESNDPAREERKVDEGPAKQDSVEANDTKTDAEEGQVSGGD
ncbi:MAG: putative DNA binding domain-containing protein, partial [Chloroflexota bacterium]|nr:putative DNA binding domain-containing protein [Chloroflexota bacterium]